MHVLFITSTRIGDAVMSTGVLKALVDRYPAARFTIACGPLAAPLFAAVPRLERIIIVRKRRFDLHWFDLWKQAAPIVWDAVVDLRRSLIAYTLRAGARYVLGPDDTSRPRVATLPSAIGIATPLDPHVFTEARHTEAAARIIPDGMPVVGIGPVASLADRTWPIGHFTALVAQLTATGGVCAGWRVAAFGGPGDEAAATAVLANVAPESRIMMVGAPDLLLVHATLARCRVFVGNDSGLSHLAAAAGTPTLAVFGRSDPARKAPWGRHCAAIRSPDPGDMATLTPGSVATALAELLGRT